jgi:hypothetical protein
MDKNPDITNFAVSLIIKAVVIAARFSGIVWVVVKTHLSIVFVLIPLTFYIGQELDNPDAAIAREFALVVPGIKGERQADLLEIVPARNAFGLVPCPAQRRHEYRQQYSNDCDYYQQFD